MARPGPMARPGLRRCSATSPTNLPATADEPSPQRGEVWLVSSGPSVGDEIQKIRPANGRPDHCRQQTPPAPPTRRAWTRRHGHRGSRDPRARHLADVREIDRRFPRIGTAAPGSGGLSPEPVVPEPRRGCHGPATTRCFGGRCGSWAGHRADSLAKLPAQFQDGMPRAVIRKARAQERHPTTTTARAVLASHTRSVAIYCFTGRYIVSLYVGFWPDSE